MTESRDENTTTELLGYQISWEPQIENSPFLLLRGCLHGLSMINSVKDLLPSATEGSQWVALRQECLLSVI